MASLNLSINGPSIKSSYAGVVSAAAPSSNSPTYAQWALFSVQAPLLNAFQDGGAKESILKVQSTGDGDLTELVEDFSEGRIQFAFVRVKDPNTALPKFVLIAWCGGGVPERTKGYFTSHLAAVSKVLHGYHVQITARSDADLEPASVMQKVADASGAKYSAGQPAGSVSSPPPPVKSKPVFTPTSSAGRGVDAIIAARSRKDDNVDADGWGADAPPVTRTQVEKVAPAYQPTKVNMAQLTSQKPEPSRLISGARQADADSDVVRGGYQPVGKVDIAAIRAQAQKTGDDRPAPVRGAYEPIGKVDIAAIRAKAQKPTEDQEESAPTQSLSDRAAVFSQTGQSERLTSLPKPKVAKKWEGASSFAGTKAPTPGGLGFGSPSVPTAAPVGAASRTFADQGGKTPAQIWAEKKAMERGGDVGTSTPLSPSAPVGQQTTGNSWKSGYTGKSWAPVQTGGHARGPSESLSQENTGEERQPAAEQEEESAQSGVAALRDRFKNTAPIGAASPSTVTAREEAPLVSHPAADGAQPRGGFALPGLPSRPPPADEEEEEAEDPSAYEPVAEERDPSPIRIAAPVPRGPEPVIEKPEERPPPPLPTSEIPVPQEDDLQDEREVEDVARKAASAVAEQTFEPETQVPSGQAHQQGGKRAIVQYDYEKAEDNEIELVEGEYVTNIDMVDDDWWMGTNAKGESGLFPSNYVEIVEDEVSVEAAAPPPPPPAAREPKPEPEPTPAPSASSGPTATALYDYEAAEDNELSFPEDAKVTNLEFPDEDWWFGHYNGDSGLFPANYVQLDS